MKRISVITGTRADYGILRPVIRKIHESKKLELCLIVTGTHLSKKHGMTINEIKKDRFPISAKINIGPNGNTNYHMAKTVGEGIIKMADIFKKMKPDINLLLGDRDEVLASAVAAYHMNIPNAHIHGGDKTLGGIDEYNRHAITKISNIHFVATKKSKERVMKMGEDLKFIFLTGSPSIDELIEQRITSKKELEKKYKINFKGDEILFLQHPVTTQTNSSKKQINNSLNAIVKLQKTTIAIAPNSDAGNYEIFEQLKIISKKYDFVKLFSNIPRKDYLGLLKNCGVLVGNSSSGIIESGFYNTPVVNIGIRQKFRERGNNVIDVEDNSTKKIYSAIKKSLENKMRKNNRKMIYGNGNSSKKIVKHLEKIQITDKLLQKKIIY